MLATTTHDRGIGAGRVLPSEVSLLRGLAVARWTCWAWSVGAVTLARADLARPWLAGVLLAAMLAANIAASWAVGTRPELLVHPVAVIVECALGFLLLVGDGWAFDEGHAFATSQNLAATWPLIAVLSAAVAVGSLGGALLGAAVASGRVIGAWANGAATFTRPQWASLTATMVFYVLGGAVAGWIAALLRRVELEVVTTRAREEVARTLHDGVLQTLALVERRVGTSDPDLAAVARASDRELRAWLYHGSATSGGSLSQQVRVVGDRVAAMYDIDVDVNVIDDGAPFPAGAVAAVVGAIQEAATNAAKHAGASRIVVYAEVDDAGVLFASVRDDGIGFDPATQPPGRGIEQSIRARMADVAGSCEIDSAPGKGTEVRLWIGRRSER